jgi:hypothetical protein
MDCKLAGEQNKISFPFQCPLKVLSALRLSVCKHETNQELLEIFLQNSI